MEKRWNGDPSKETELIRSRTGYKSPDCALSQPSSTLHNTMLLRTEGWSQRRTTERVLLVKNKCSAFLGTVVMMPDGAPGDSTG